jgi:hypothetical protein
LLRGRDLAMTQSNQTQGMVTIPKHKDARAEYWVECVAIAFEDCGLTATSEQITAVAADVQSGAENIGQAFYQPESPLPGRIAELERRLKVEVNKITCRACNGYGRIREYFGTFMSDSQCSKCHGEGRHSP